MSLRPNDTCFIKQASPESINFYRNHSTKNPFLIRPCSIPRDEVLIIDRLLTESIAVVHYLYNPTKVSVLYLKDLVKAKKG